MYLRQDLTGAGRAQLGPGASEEAPDALRAGWLDRDLRMLEAVSLGGETVLYAATGPAGGIVAWRLGDGGALEPLDYALFPALFGSEALALIPDGAGGFEILTGAAESQPGGASGVLSYDITATGEIGAAGVAAGVDPHGLRAGDAVMVGDVLYTANARTGTITALREGTPLTGARDDLAITGAARLEAVTLPGGQSFLLALDHSERGLAAYRITPSGDLGLTATLGPAEGLGIAAPTALATVTLSTGTFVLVGAAGSSSISVARLGADGSLTATDHVIDTLGTRFGGLSVLEAVVADGHAFVLAGGADDGLSLFTLLEDGRLIHLETLAHETGRALTDLSALEFVEVDGRLEIYLASEEAAGIAHWSLAATALGTVRLGGAGDVEGGAGHDILELGPGATATGGAGADRFLLAVPETPDPGAPLSTITDFTAGEDILDLSAFHGAPAGQGVTHPGDVLVSPQEWGALLSFGDVRLRLESASGTPLMADDIWQGGFDWPSSVLVQGTTPAREPDPPPGNVEIDWERYFGADGRPGGTEGGGTGETGDTGETGGGPSSSLWTFLSGNSTLPSFEWSAGGPAASGDPGVVRSGTAAPEEIYGTADNDTLRGGAGDDLLGGGAGFDTIEGDAGADEIYGAQGDDYLRGGTGHDTLGGFDGNDTLDGGWGRDDLWGARGDDRIDGGEGADMLGGFTGNDTLRGGAGNDEAWGAAGNDLLAGEDGADTLGAGTGDDTVSGGMGDDFIYGGAGNDLVVGDGGDDSLYAFTGNDEIQAGWGDDHIWSGAGEDWISGGGGADTFYFAASSGHDLIVDFEAGLDRIHIYNPALSFESLDITANAEGAQIRFGGATISLLDTWPYELTAEDFSFG